MTEERTPMKWRGFLLTVAALIGIAILGALIPIRSCDVITSGGEVLGNGSDLYIFVEQNKLAWSENLWFFSRRLVRRWLNGTSPPDFRRIDCTVYHITGKTVYRNQAKGWHVIGALAPYRGAPHAFMGSDLNWDVYRWTGSEFSRLPSVEGTTAKSGHTYLRELFKRDGWIEGLILPVRGTAIHKFTLDGSPITIQASQTTEQSGSRLATTSRLELIKNGDPKSTHVLYEFKDTSGFLTAHEYTQFTQ